MNHRYFEVYRTINIEGIRYSNAFGELLAKNMCPECEHVDSELSHDCLEIRRLPENVLVNWTSYPRLDCGLPVIRNDLLELLREMNLLNGSELRPLRLESGEKVEGFTAFVPPIEVRRRGNQSAEHAICPKCRFLAYNPKGGTDLVAQTMAGNPAIAHDGWLLIFEQRLLARLSPGQLSGLRKDELALVEHPQDRLTTVLPIYADAKWKRRYLECGGFIDQGPGDYTSAKMTAAME